MADLRNYKVSVPGNSDIIGKHLKLEPYNRDKHLNDIWNALGGADGINERLKFFPNDDFEVPDDLGAWLDAGNKNGSLVTFVAINDASQVLGMASYMRIDTKYGSIEVGAVAHGSGMARSPLSTELHYLMARNAFDMGYRRYEWKCHNENGPSKKAAIRYGFTFEGVFRQHMISKGKNRDTAWFAMIDKEWPVIREAFELWLEPHNFDAEGRQIRKLEDIRATLNTNADKEE